MGHGVLKSNCFFNEVLKVNLYIQCCQKFKRKLRLVCSLYIIHCNKNNYEAQHKIGTLQKIHLLLDNNLK